MRKVNRVKQTLGLVAPLVVLCVMAGSATAGTIAITVRASSAPNAFGSPSWSAYAANAMSSLQSGGGNVGDRNVDPTAYEILGPSFEPGDAMVTSFNSWRGLAGPTGAFAGELGNRLHFGMAAIGDGSEQFTLRDVTFAITSSDGVLNYFDDLSGTTLNGTTRIGVNYGADRVLGGGDDLLYMSGESDTTVLDALFYVGAGNAYWPGGLGDPLTGQAALDATALHIEANHVSVTGSYAINGFSGSTTVASAPLPSAAVMGLGLLGALGVAARIKRRRPETSSL
jgi:hypothetical protein